MIVGKIRTFLAPLRRLLGRNSDKFLKDLSGVVHVGANLGQERELYRAHGLSVVWIEPIPKVFDQLRINIQGFTNQIAFRALVTDEDDKEYEFYIANNDGKSSSILKLKQHKDIWPDIDYTTTLMLRSITLNTLFKKEGIDVGKYQALVVDTQGSELLVLRGGLPLIHNFKFIKIEVPDFESYEGCCQLSDTNKFMIRNGYEELYRNKFVGRAKGGSYFDVVYKRKA